MISAASLVGKCFKELQKEDSDKVYLNPLCFKEHVFTYYYDVGFMRPDGHVEMTDLSFVWSDWYVNGNKLFFKDSRVGALGHCAFKLEKEILVLGPCDNDNNVLSGRWRQEQNEDLKEK